nr:MAG TPA: hypothetical protein [Caudoviricetes sp.]
MPRPGRVATSRLLPDYGSSLVAQEKRSCSALGLRAGAFLLRVINKKVNSTSFALNVMLYQAYVKNILLR